MKKLFSILIIILALGACGTVGTRTVKEEFIVKLDSQQLKAGEIEAQFERQLSIGGLKKDSITVIYFPNEDAVCLQHRADFTTYYQFWNRSGRQVFIDGLEKYKEDYAARSLNKSGRLAKRNYGSVDGYLIWQMYRYTAQSYGSVELEIGYDFRDRFPYFIINQREVSFHESNSRDIRYSPEMSIFFSRAQAENLAVLFDQQYLQSLVSANANSVNSRDDY